MRRLAAVALVTIAVAGACKRRSEPGANLNAANKVAMRLVHLYYESPQMLLDSEPRNIALPESAAAAMPLVVRELLKGPAAATSLRLFPEGTVARGVYLLPGGTAIVDLGGPPFAQGWGTGSHTELMAAHSIVQTLVTNFAETKRVHILVNGTPADTLGGHLSLARSLTPMPVLVAPPKP